MWIISSVDKEVAGSSSPSHAPTSRIALAAWNQQWDDACSWYGRHHWELRSLSVVWSVWMTVAGADREHGRLRCLELQRSNSNCSSHRGLATKGVFGVSGNTALIRSLGICTNMCLKRLRRTRGGRRTTRVGSNQFPSVWYGGCFSWFLIQSENSVVAHGTGSPNDAFSVQASCWPPFLISNLQSPTPSLQFLVIAWEGNP
jgi:hypothetical protein